LPDHQYILRPVTGGGKLKVNKHQSMDGEPNEGNFEFKEFALVLDDQQYASVMLLLSSFTAYTISQKVRTASTESFKLD
jgi:vacuolar protein sorting-associated protein 13A/C